MTNTFFLDKTEEKAKFVKMITGGLSCIKPI